MLIAIACAESCQWRYFRRAERHFDAALAASCSSCSLVSWRTMDSKCRYHPGYTWRCIKDHQEVDQRSEIKTGVSEQTMAHGTLIFAPHLIICPNICTKRPRQRGQAMPYWRLLQKSPPERRPPLRSMRCSTVFCSCGLYHHPTSPSVMRRKNIEKSV